MKIIVVGSGGREHALAWRLACGAGSSPRKDREVVVVPGNAGIARFFRCAAAATVDDIVGVVEREQADLVVVGPEAWLDAGLVDALRERDVPCFGPEAGATSLESSKAFMKSVARAAGVPTADFVVARRLADAEEFLASRRGRGVVVKASGLCAGKGVVVCADVDEARRELGAMLGEGSPAAEAAGPRFGPASRTVVVEDLLPGAELSVFGLCDGEDAVILGAARDHKRLLDDDRGPNTGGMGAVAPLGPDEGVTPAFLEDIRQRFFLPTLQEMQRRGTPFRGVLFAGLMLDGAGAPALLEWNVRFGDPETEALLFALDIDLAPIFLAVGAWQPLPPPLFSAVQAAVQRALDAATYTGHAKAATVVVATEGYPEAPERGQPLTGLLRAERVPDVKVFYAGVARGSFGLVVDGGRVLAVTGRGVTFDDALDRAYRAVDQLGLQGLQVRRDIGRSVRRRRNAPAM
jgi:phosphoribosylamine--glycine ligase